LIGGPAEPARKLLMPDAKASDPAVQPPPRSRFMMARRIGLFSALAYMATSAAGCVPPTDTTSMNLPSRDAEEMRHDLAETFAYQNDQGMMADRSIADIHFVPHTTHLSGTGEARLERYAELLSETGGTINYDTNLNDTDLVQARVAVAQRFLESCQTQSPLEVAVGLPGGRGMKAREAIPGRAVAEQPEPRGTAYKLGPSLGSAQSSN
jgi:hypothetical protein